MAGKRRLQRVFPDAEGPEAAASPGLAAGPTMDAAEVEFLAEKELVTIIPNFSLDKIDHQVTPVRTETGSGFTHHCTSYPLVSVARAGTQYMLAKWQPCGNLLWCSHLTRGLSSRGSDTQRHYFSRFSSSQPLQTARGRVTAESGVGRRDGGTTNSLWSVRRSCLSTQSLH